MKCFTRQAWTPHTECNCVCVCVCLYVCVCVCVCVCVERSIEDWGQLSLQEHVSVPSLLHSEGQRDLASCHRLLLRALDEEDEAVLDEDLEYPRTAKRRRT